MSLVPYFYQAPPPLAPAAQSPTTAPQWRPSGAEQPGWHAKPLASGALALLTAVTFFGAPGQAPSKLWRYEHETTPEWVGSAKSAPLGLLAVQAPVKRWWYRYDGESAAPWIGRPQGSAPLRLLSHQEIYGAGGQVPTQTWHFQAVAQADWIGAPRGNALVAALTAPGQAKPIHWYFGDASIASWQHTPRRNESLFSSAQAPVAPVFWHYACRGDETWNWQPSRNAALEESAGPTPRFVWRLDFQEHVGWVGAPLASPIEYLPAPPIPPVETPTGGGGKRRKRSIRPIWDLQGEKDALAAATREESPAIVARSATAPRTLSSARRLPVWRVPQLVPELPRQSGMVIPLPRRANFSATEEDDKSRGGARVYAVRRADLCHADEHDQVAAALHVDPSDMIIVPDLTQDDEDAVALLLDNLDET